MNCPECGLTTWRGLCPACDEVVYDMELERISE